MNRLLRIQCGPSCAAGAGCANQEVARGRGAAVAAAFISDSKGWGLVASEDVPAGAFVAEMTGEVLPPAAAAGRLAEYAKERRHAVHVFDLTPSGGEVVDATRMAGGPARFVNHRCAFGGCAGARGGRGAAAARTHAERLEHGPHDTRAHTRHASPPPLRCCSCDPNCEWQNWDVAGEQRLCLFARRAAAAGEELTVDYALRAHATKSSACVCRSDNCAGRVPEVVAAL